MCTALHEQDFAEAKKLTLAFALTLQEVSAAADGGAVTENSLTTTDSTFPISSYTAKALPGVTDWLTRLQVRYTSITVKHWTVAALTVTFPKRNQCHFTCSNHTLIFALKLCLYVLLLL